MFSFKNVFVIGIMMFLLVTVSFAQDPDSSWTQTSQFVDFDSLNARFVGSWPFADAFSCAYDDIRGLVFLGSGGGVYILDVTNPNAPTQLSEQIHTQGYVMRLFYEGASHRLYIAAGAVGLEIWDVSNPIAPIKTGHLDTGDCAQCVFVYGSYAYIADHGDGLRIIDISTPSNPVEVGSYDTPGWTEGVYVSGSYAYVADYNCGLRIIDISNPAHPDEVGSYVPSQGFPTDVYVSGIYAYIANYGDGLRIINISTPANPQEVGWCNTPTQASRVFISSSYAYVANKDGGLRVINISNPATPHEIGNYIPTDNPVWDVCVSNSYAYIANHVAGLRVLDISDPTLPDKIGEYGARSSALDIAISGSYAYVADRGAGLRVIDISNTSDLNEIGHFDNMYGETFGIDISGSYAYLANYATGLWVINISDPANPLETGHCPIGVNARNVFVSGSYAYIAAGLAGLKVIDISSPSNPFQVGYYDTPGEAYDVFVSGSYAYVADRSEGLQVIDVSDPRNPHLEGHCNIEDEAWGIYVSGFYAYVAAHHEGLRVINITSPSNPYEVSHCDTPGLAMGVNIAGYFAYVADHDGGLRIIDIFNPQNPQEVGYYNTHYSPQNSFSVAVSGSNIYLGTYRAGVQIFENLLIPLITDDPLALAYNGNKHLVREINTDNLHLVYTNNGKVIYRYSGDGGENWTIAKTIDEGLFPAICLDFQGNPCVAWTKTDNHLCFARKDPSLGWVMASYTFGTSQPNHPCIAITHQDITYTDSVHIIFRLFDNGFLSNSIQEIVFPSTNPQNYNTFNIDNNLGLHMVTLDFPSTAIDYIYKLYATWMHGDTVYYGTRTPGQSRWNKNINPFGLQGRNSAHPFIETYGDSVFVVWQNESNGEVYRGRKYLLFPNFSWSNLSQTPTTLSNYPVNASGLVTTFVDEALPLAEQDIFWKTYPGQPLHNLSNTPTVKSIYPHASLWIPMEQVPQQYTVWQEGNTSPYIIKFEKVIINSALPLAFFTSVPGFSIPSLHLAERDSFISSWRIPVDIGHDVVAYQFPLDPKYRYRMKAAAYKEYGNTWSMKVNIDGNEMGKIEYDANKQESLVVLIPPESYKDSIIKVVFNNDVGDYAAVGPVYIYRYEVSDKDNKGGLPGGAMSQNSHSLINEHLTVFPNPFGQSVNIKFRPQRETKYCIKAYDVSGRLVKKIYDGLMIDNRTLCWNGDDVAGRTVPQGIYFLTIENLVSGKVMCEKILKIE